MDVLLQIFEGGLLSISSSPYIFGAINHLIQFVP